MFSSEEFEEEDEEIEFDTKSVASSVPEIIKSKNFSTHREMLDESSPKPSEAEKAMIAAKKRHEDEENAKLQDYEDRRRIEREREEEELRLLKEKQEQRNVQREKEELEMVEKRRQDEERRQIEEEERKLRLEDERKKKEEIIRKRQQLMGVGFVSTPTGGRNFIIPEKKDRGDKFGNIVQAKQEMGMTKDQQEEAKRNFLVSIMKALDLSSLNGVEFKAKIKEMHQRICKLETDKYDMEKRQERQEYDLKELNERQSQVRRREKKMQGATNSRFPNKVSILSKYDRQIDRRNFNERRSMFDKKNAFPCFPNIPPPPAILEFKLNATSSSFEGNSGGLEQEYYEEFDVEE